MTTQIAFVCCICLRTSKVQDQSLKCYKCSDYFCQEHYFSDTIINDIVVCECYNCKLESSHTLSLNQYTYLVKNKITDFQSFKDFTKNSYKQKFGTLPR